MTCFLQPAIVGNEMVSRWTIQMFCYIMVAYFYRRNTLARLVQQEKLDKQQ